mmetsp:Transcript_2464/g.2777  ORF Transcript_2464/g.2777 Transcript_2464/m.2777 type:complete len:327 (+) Transcript_2464:279-1259(+)|eukprot:CAMPEP_0184016564 /NCGR_PEP_ID=MMETSP0954-20121128/7000_1 /TAXON_ID=627963 /ORGANISM="Aplanochytrium sp, Strain PBS07" /LENGTH=326 /DNA_ID=CAMNT_0026297601 /DNA_START=270 /DNA_END=1253 /DNA_ORIENTATION=+
MGNACLKDEDTLWPDFEGETLVKAGRQNRTDSESTICLEDSDEEHYYWIFEGIIGSGRSSSLNTLFNSNKCKVVGGQLQGTRGAKLEEFIPTRSDELDIPVSFVDVEGFRADVPASEEEIAAHKTILKALMSPTEVEIAETDCANSLQLHQKFYENKSKHQYFIVLDLEQRIAAPMLENLRIICEMYASFRTRCFICFTKWNSNAVMTEWNHKLKLWCRKNKKKFIEGFDDAEENGNELPSENEMLRDYLDFLGKKFSTPTEQEVLQKLSKLLAGFENRILWMFNLDCLELEDKEDGELPAYIDFMYNHYRKKALEKVSIHYKKLS